MQNIEEKKKNKTQMIVDLNVKIKKEENAL